MLGTYSVGFARRVVPCVIRKLSHVICFEDLLSGEEVSYPTTMMRLACNGSGDNSVIKWNVS